MLDFDLIATYLEHGLILFMTVAAYLYLVAAVYPRLTLRAVWTHRVGRQADGGDRGVRKLQFFGGYAVVYEPEPAIRRFIRRYALIKQDGCVYIRCRMHHCIAHVRYDVTAFDCQGRLLDVLSVSELIRDAGYSTAVRLPRDTAYVRVTLRQADDMYRGRDTAGRCSRRRMAVYAVLTLGTTVAAMGMLYRSLGAIMAGVRKAIPLLEGEMPTPEAAFALSLAVGLFVALWGLFMYRMKVGKL